MLSCCAVPMVAGLLRRRQDAQDADAARHVADQRSRSALLAATGLQAREQLANAENALAVLADSDLARDKRAALVAEAHHAVRYVSRLVADISDLARLHAGALETYLRQVDLDEVLAVVLEDLGPRRAGSRADPAREPARRDRGRRPAYPDPEQPDRQERRIDSPERQPARRSPPTSRAGQRRGPRHRPGAPSVAARRAGSLGFRLRGTSQRRWATRSAAPNPGRGRAVIITLPAAVSR